jgi:hypothetical protein
VTPSRTSKAGARYAPGGLFLGLAIIAWAASAEASPTRSALQPRGGPTAETATLAHPRAEEPSETSAITKTPSDHQASCDRTRKRFWVEGEGWIVRRVAVCR